MGISIKFDTAGNPLMPKVQLANRNFHKLGFLNTIDSFTFKGNMNDAHEISFNLYKEKNGVQCTLWESVKDFKYIYIPEYDTYFEIAVTLNTTNMYIKKITATSIDKAELIQTNLYNIEINSEVDIARDDYVVTTIYNPLNANASLLNRILSKTPQWTIAHVDSTLVNIQKTFSISETTTYEFLRSTLSEEVQCYVDFNTTNRTISVYDLLYNVISTGYRGELSGIPEGTLKSDIISPHGTDTRILITNENLSSEINYVTNHDDVKNCYVIEGGDDNITATVRNISPSGTNSFYYISDDTKADMSTELSNKINDYENDYKYYNEDYVFVIDSTLKTNYNYLIQKYYGTNSGKEISDIIGFVELNKAYYNSVDFNLYLTSSFMPTIIDSPTTAADQLALLTTANLSPVAVADVSSVSIYTANSAVLLMAKSTIDSIHYKVEITSSTLIGQTWYGCFKVTNYSKDTDTATSLTTIPITINDNQQQFIEQRIQKELTKKNISGLKDLMDITDINEFDTELTKYALNRLTSFSNAYQTAIDILTEENCGKSGTVLHNNLYVPYFTRLKHIQSEILVRGNEIAIIESMTSTLTTLKSNVQTILNFENYLGETLLLEFVTFRREYKYTNSNYISTGLDNAQLIAKAQELIQVGSQALLISGTETHSLNATVSNLLVLPSFQSLKDSFELGNYLRVKVDKGQVYKLRLLSYIIDYGQIQNLTLEFSDIINELNNNRILKQIVGQVSSVSADMPNVKQQAQQGNSANTTVSTWTTKGLDKTNVVMYNNIDNQTIVDDEHGMLFRYYDDISDSYGSEQMRLYNQGVALTDNSWDSIKTAVGKFIYIDPITSEEKTGWGVNGEVIIGKLILGESLGIYNATSNLTFTADGLKVANLDSTRVVQINPNSDLDLLSYTKNNIRQLYIDSDGDLNITGKITAGSGKIGLWTIDDVSGGLLYSYPSLTPPITNKYLEIQIGNADIIDEYNLREVLTPNSLTFYKDYPFGKGSIDFSYSDYTQIKDTGLYFFKHGTSIGDQTVDVSMVCNNGNPNTLPSLDINFGVNANLKIIGGGINLGGATLSQYQSGSNSISASNGVWTSKTITFTHEFPYGKIPTILPIQTTKLISENFAITSKSRTGFTIEIYNATGSTLTWNFDWLAFLIENDV